MQNSDLRDRFEDQYLTLMIDYVVPLSRINVEG